VLGYYLRGKRVTERSVNNFEECALAGGPIMESYPRRCVTSDGRSFTEIVSGSTAPDVIPGSEDPESRGVNPDRNDPNDVSPRPSDVACTMEARQCPDGSYVGRGGLNCEFAACPK
jgi:hypothetical protein